MELFRLGIESCFDFDRTTSDRASEVARPRTSQAEGDG
jgi:hypothetical protein